MYYHSIYVPSFLKFSWRRMQTKASTSLTSLMYRTVELLSLMMLELLWSKAVLSVSPWILHRTMNQKWVDATDCRLQFLPIDAGYVQDNVNHVTAQLVALDVNRVRVRCDVNLWDNIKEKGFVNQRVLEDEVKKLKFWIELMYVHPYRGEDVQQSLQGGELRNQFLNHLGKAFKDGVVVDWSQVETHLDFIFEAQIEAIVTPALRNVPLRFQSGLVRQSVHFMDENLKANVRVHSMSSAHGVSEFVHCLSIVILKAIDHVRSSFVFTLRLCEPGHRW